MAIEIPRGLVLQAQQKKLIPFVGAGLSLGVKNTSGQQVFPSWNTLLSNSASYLSENGNPDKGTIIDLLIKVGESSPQELADKARSYIDNNWGDFLFSQFDVDYQTIDLNTLKIMKSLWKISNGLVITTNYDRSIRWSAEDPNIAIWNIASPINQGHYQAAGIRGKVAWHLHGSIDDVSKIILDSKSYDSLYKESNTDYKSALFLLRSILTENSFLFVGFSFKDDFFIRQMQFLRDMFSGSGVNHYVIVHTSEAQHVNSLGLGLNIIEVQNFDSDIYDVLENIYQLSNSSSSLENTKSAASASSENAVVRNYFNVPYIPKGDNVIGRHGTTKSIFDTLSSLGHRANLAITGIGGLGKTQIAIEYAYKYKDFYSKGVYWISAETDIQAQLVSLSDSLVLTVPDADESSKLLAFKAHMESAGNKLIIFDNVEGNFELVKYFNPVHPNLHILFTSREAVQHSRSFNIELLNSEESQKLLISETSFLPSGNQDWESVRLICDLLIGLPLAIELAGGYIRTTNISYGSYLEMLGYDSLAILGNTDILSSYTEYNRDIRSVISISDNFINRNKVLDSITDILSICSPKEVELDYVLHLLDVGVFETVIGEVHLGNSLKIYQFNDKKRTFSMHSLIREIRRTSLIEGEKYETIEIYAARAIVWFSRRVKDKDYTYAYNIDHENLDLLYSISDILTPPIRAKIIWLSSYTNYYRGDFKTAKIKLNIAMKMYEDFSLNDEAFLADIYNDLAQNEFTDTRFTIECETKALSIRERIFGDNHKDTIISLTNLSKTISKNSDNSGAVDLINRALAAAEVVFSVNSRDYARICMAASSIYTFLKQRNISISYSKKAKDILEKLGLNISREMAILLNTQGQIYFHENNHKMAVNCLSEALEIIEDLYSEDNPERALFYFNLGMTYISTDKKHMALESFEKSNGLYVRIFGEDHPMSIDSAIMHLKVLFLLSGRKKESVIPRITEYIRTTQSLQFRYALNELRKTVLFNKPVYMS